MKISIYLRFIHRIYIIYNYYYPFNSEKAFIIQTPLKEELIKKIQDESEMHIVSQMNFDQYFNKITSESGYSRINIPFNIILRHLNKEKKV